jgi:hypothetical protein
MKAALIVINKAFPQDATSRPGNAWAVGVPIKVNKKGFPLFLHPTVRNNLAAGDVVTFRVWASILNTYKVFSFASVTTLDTITDPPLSYMSDKREASMKLFAQKFFWPSILGSKDSSLWEEKEARKYLPESDRFFFTAGPNSSVSSFGWLKDLAVWAAISGELEQSALWDYCTQFSQSKMKGTISRGFKILQDSDVTIDDVSPRHAEIRVPESWISMTRYAKADAKARETMGKTWNTIPGWLGKLHAIPEPAGKVRIVAMVDSLTQTVLGPLHDWMNSILRRFPQDATFDQEGKLKAYVSRGIATQFCYDLSAATDRIPEVVYRIVFGASPLGPKRTDSWLSLLLDRAYHIPDSMVDYIKPGTLKSRYVEYATGQPMGALSSWPSMAISHHFLVQFAAQEAFRLPSGKGLFTEYLVLGDDVVIGDEAVALKYLDIMQALGVKISPTKSYESRKGLVNFANQTYIGLMNVSPLSIKEALQVKDLLSALALGARALSRGFLANPSAKRDYICQRMEVPDILSGSGETSLDLGSKESTGVEVASVQWTPASLLRLLVGPDSWLAKVCPAMGGGRLTPASRLGLFAWFYPSPLFRVLGLKNYSYAALAWVLTTHTPKLMKVRESLAAGVYPPTLDQDTFLFALRELLRWVSKSIDLEAQSCLDKYECLEGFCDQLPSALRQAASIYWSGRIDTALDAAFDAQISIRRILSYIENPVKTIYVQIGKDRVMLQKGGEGLDQHKLVLLILQTLEGLIPLPEFGKLEKFIQSGKELKSSPEKLLLKRFNNLLQGINLVAGSLDQESRTGRPCLLGTVPC